MSEEKKTHGDGKESVVSGTFTAKEFAELLKSYAQSNQEGLKEFAKELAFSITHPEPTDKEKELRLQQIKLRIDRCREEDALREAKRKNCVHPARPNFP